MWLHFLIVIIIATLPLVFGAVQPRVWSFYSAAMTIAFLAAWWQKRINFTFLKQPLVATSIGAFLIYSLFQLVPLPISVTKYVSPRQYDILVESSAIIGSTMKWQALSYDWRHSFSWWVFLVSLMLFATVVQSWMKNEKNLFFIIWSILLLSLIEAVYGLAQTLIPTMGVLWADVNAYLGDARGTFINRNHYAGFMEMVWPLGLAMMIILTGHERHGNKNDNTLKKRLKYFLAADKSGLHFLLCAAMLFILLTLLFSKSRAGIAGALIGGILFILFSYGGGKRFSFFTWLTMGLGVMFLLFYSNVIGFEKIIGRFMTVDESAVSRVNIWKDTLTMIKDHPLGIGLGNYEQLMPVYNTRGPLGVRFTHAHNDFLEILAESGWPGFVFVVGGFFVFFARTVSGLLNNGAKMAPGHFYIGIGACCGMASIMFHSLFDFNLHIPSNLVYFVLLMMISVSVAREKRHSEV